MVLILIEKKNSIDDNVFPLLSFKIIAINLYLINITVKPLNNGPPIRQNPLKRQ